MVKSIKFIGLLVCSYLAWQLVWIDMSLDTVPEVIWLCFLVSHDPVAEKKPNISWTCHENFLTLEVKWQKSLSYYKSLKVFWYNISGKSYQRFCRLAMTKFFEIEVQFLFKCWRKSKTVFLVYWRNLQKEFCFSKPRQVNLDHLLTSNSKKNHKKMPLNDKIADVTKDMRIPASEVCIH